MAVIAMKESKEIKAIPQDVVKTTVTHLSVKNIKINVSDDRNITGDIEIALGYMNESTFIEVSLGGDSSYIKIHIPASEFEPIADSPLSPAERGMSPKLIIENRVIAYAMSHSELI